MLGLGLICPDHVAQARLVSGQGSAWVFSFSAGIATKELMEYWQPSCHCEERTHLQSSGGTWQLLSRKQSWKLHIVLRWGLTM